MKKEVDKEVVLKNHTLNVLERFLRRLKITNVEDSSIQLFHIIKNYFASKYNIRYSFTYEELEKELANRRIDSKEKQKILDLLKVAEEYEYKKFPNKKIEHERIKKIAREFKRYILKAKNQIENSNEQKGFKISVFHPIIKRVKGTKNNFAKRKNSVIVGKEKREENTGIRKEQIEKKKIKEPKEELESIYELLLEGNELLNFNLEEAQKKYELIREIYNKLSIEEKKSVREEIVDFYNKIIEKMK
ncbi:MAG: hypothetical protein ACP5OZ_01055 [Candidatus Woesearchaeota archaeon]